MDDENKLPSDTQEKVKEESRETTVPEDTKTQMVNNSSSVSGSDNEVSKCEQHVNSQEARSANEVNEVSNSLEDLDIKGTDHDNKG